MGMAHGTHDRSAANAWAVVELLGFSNWEALQDGNVRHGRGVGN